MSGTKECQNAGRDTRQQPWLSNSIRIDKKRSTVDIFQSTVDQDFINCWLANFQSTVDKIYQLFPLKYINRWSFFINGMLFDNFLLTSERRIQKQYIFPNFNGWGILCQLKLGHLIILVKGFVTKTKFTITFIWTKYLHWLGNLGEFHTLLRER